MSKQAAADPFREAAWQDLRSTLIAAINQLPERYAAALALCYLDGKTHHEAARQLGCPAGSMSWRLQKGRELLRQRLTCTGRKPAAESPVGERLASAQDHLD
jgi:RNA polymerase sigma factor (sigma-70 family)